MVDGVDLVDDQIGNDVVVTGAAVHQPRLRIELGDLVGGLLNVARADTETLGYLAPAVIDQLLEAVADQSVRNGLLETCLAQLKHEALPQVARTNARWIEHLHGAEHFLRIFHREQRVVRVAIRLFRGLLDDVVDSVEYHLKHAGLAQADLGRARRHQITLVIDIADELLGQQKLPVVEVQQFHLIPEVIRKIA